MRVGSPPPGSSFQSIFRPALRAFCVLRSSSAPQISARSVSPPAISSAKRFTRYWGMLPPEWV